VSTITAITGNTNVRLGAVVAVVLALIGAAGWVGPRVFSAGAAEHRLVTVESKAERLDREMAAHAAKVEAMRERQDERIGKVEGAIIQQTEQYRFIRESIERIERRSPPR
jgi:uncharacterized protein HemX